MNTFEFINYLRRLNIKLSVNGDRLLYKASPETLSKDLQAEIKGRKTDIINILKQSQSKSSLPRGKF